MRGAAAVVLAVLVAAGPAHAYLKAGPVGYGHWLKATTVQDGMATSLSAAYSFRKVRSAYAGSAVKLRRTTGGTQDVGFTAGGDFDTAAAATFCAATTCFLDTWYDQSGLARHSAQSSTAAQPEYVASCIGTLPCARSTTGSQFTQYVAATPGTTMTFGAVAKRTGTGDCYWISNNSANAFRATPATANSWRLDGGAGTIVQAAADGAWHAGIGVMNTTSSLVRIDAAETAASSVTAGLATGQAIYLVAFAGAATQCDMTEALLWDNYALTAAERIALAENQKNYWAPLPLDTFATPAAAYSMRRLKSTYTGPAIRLRRALDGEELDIGFLGFTSFTGAPIDTAAANAHCAATTCSVVTWYDQSGNARHSILQGAEVPPAYVANCNGSLPCARTTGDQRIYASGPYAAVLPVTFSALGNRSVGTGACNWPNHFGANLFNAWATIPDQWVLIGGASGFLGAVATDNNWHAGIGVVNGASSVVRIDATETTGTTTGSTASANLVGFWGSAATTCSTSEVIAWNGYAATATERAALTANQRSFWGLP